MIRTITLDESDIKNAVEDYVRDRFNVTGSLHPRIVYNKKYIGHGMQESETVQLTIVVDEEEEKK